MIDNIVYLNGEYIKRQDAKVSVDDRGYLFSDGIYDVMLILNKTIIDFDLHLQRIKSSLEGMKINYRVDSKEIESIINELIQRNYLTNASIYLQITRGAAPRIHQFPTPEPKPSIYINISEYDPNAFNDKKATGVKAITFEDRRWKNRNYKTISLLANILARQEAVSVGAEEAILVETDNIITECTSANLFIIDKLGNLRTHPADNKILNGVTRIGVILVVKDQGLNIIEEPFTLENLLDANEIFLSSTTKHIMPIVQVDDKLIGDGKVGAITKRLMQSYETFISDQYE